MKRIAKKILFSGRRAQFRIRAWLAGGEHPLAATHKQAPVKYISIPEMFRILSDRIDLANEKGVHQHDLEEGIPVFLFEVERDEGTGNYCALSTEMRPRHIGITGGECIDELKYMMYDMACCDLDSNDPLYIGYDGAVRGAYLGTREAFRYWIEKNGFSVEKDGYSA